MRVLARDNRSLERTDLENTQSRSGKSIAVHFAYLTVRSRVSESDIESVLQSNGKYHVPEVRLANIAGPTDDYGSLHRFHVQKDGNNRPIAAVCRLGR